jgi:hypothetical protein
MPFFAPTQSGTRCEAIQMVEWAAQRPSGYRGQPMPPALKISQLAKEVATVGDSSDA